MTDKTPATPELPEPELGYIGTDKSRQPAFSARQMREALQSAQPAAAVSDEELDRMDMEAQAEANQNPHGTLYHWRKAYLQAFARAILALRPQAVPMTRAQRLEAFRKAEDRMAHDINLCWRDALIEETEAHHGITQRADGGEVE